MGFINILFQNIESLFLNFTFNHLINLFILLLICGILYLIHRFIIKRKYKNMINKSQEFKKVFIESEYLLKKENLLKIYIISFIFLSSLIVFKDNLTYLIPIFSGIAIIFLFSIREQLNNIILGVLFRSSIGTTIHEGLVFYFLEKKDPFEVVKINFLKTILKNKRTGRIESVEHSSLNKEHIIIKSFKDLDFITFNYRISTYKNINSYVKNITNILEKRIEKQKINLNDIKKDIFISKSKYNTTPHLKPFFDIHLEYFNKDEIDVKIELTIYNYDYDKYIEDFLLFNP